MKFVFEVKDLHVHVHIHGSDAEALAKVKELTNEVGADTATMQTAVDQAKENT